MRETSIRIGKDEKDLLDRVAEERFGTDDIPYGHTIKVLCEDELSRLKESE